MEQDLLAQRQLTVLTAGRRLAYALRLAHARQAQAQGLKVWRTPRILPWATWLRQQWLEARAAGGAASLRLLNATQARALWNEVVASSAAGAKLLDPASAARLAARSWQRMQEYRISLEQLAADEGFEASVLSGWCHDFLSRCEALSAIDEPRLAAWADEVQLVPDEPVALAGFDLVPPALERLLERWRAAGRLLAPAAEHTRAARIEVIAAADRDEEIELAARWARAQVERGRERIGIVLPDLEARRAQAARVFEDVFAPGARGTPTPSTSAPVVLAAPLALSAYPLVDAALLILQLAVPGGSASQAGRLLRSPFLIGGVSEADLRALADFRLREQQREQWDWFELERWAGVTGCTRLQLQARALAARVRAERTPALPSRWVERFHGWLQTSGWPGERALDSIEQQTLRKFQTTLAEFGTLDALSAPLSLPAALQRLRRLLQDTAFEPETQPGAVLVIDATTVGGMSFDALWIAGLDANSLPGPVDPDPLLPLDLQRAAGLPQARAEGVLQRARMRLQGWLHSAPEVVLSWPRQEGEAVLQPSPLLAPWSRGDAQPEGRPASRPSSPGEPVQALSHEPTRAFLREPGALRFAATRALRRSLFEQRPRLQPLRDEHVPALNAGAARGGARTLELQSRCSFRAQAELRLHAQALPVIPIGVAPLERGKIVHEVLADLWRSLGSQQELLAKDDQLLEQQVRTSATSHALRTLEPLAIHRARLAALEVDSIVAQVMRLLQLEKRRAPFTVRFAEQAASYDIGGMRITLRPDRIDELAQGGQLLIDYKLGDSHQPRQWLEYVEGRPPSPQLPLYGLAHEANLQGIAFVVLAPGAVEYRGWSNGATIGPGIVPYPAGVRLRADAPADWPGLLRRWRVVLTQLAGQFVAGFARPDPLLDECARCHLASLCRIEERQRLANGQVHDD